MIRTVITPAGQARIASRCTPSTGQKLLENDSVDQSNSHNTHVRRKEQLMHNEQRSKQVDDTTWEAQHKIVPACRCGM